MTATTYQHCYRILRTHGDCNLKELRLAYRRRVRLCHPDRLPPDAAEMPGRDDEFKQVVLAYRLLLRFYMRHGEMPPPYLAVSESAIVVTGPSDASREKPEKSAAGKGASTKRAFTWLPSPFHRTLVAVFAGGVCAAALLQRFDYEDAQGTVLSRSAEQVLPESELPARESAAENRIAVGMDPQSVVDIQGVPTYTKGSVWFYGDSGVIFDKGCVIGWENQPPFPLRTLVSTAWLLGSGSGNSDSNFNDCSLPN
ncbi:MAG TPA: J domain-containing protein [Gammaproteobacteria bacterium]